RRTRSREQSQLQSGPRVITLVTARQCMECDGRLVRHLLLHKTLTGCRHVKRAGLPTIAGMRSLNPKDFNSFTLLALAIAVTVPRRAQNTYVKQNLTSDIRGLGDHPDKKLVNAGGMDRSASSPWWVNANGTGFSLVYDGRGAGAPAAGPLAVPVAVPAGDQ